MTYFYATKTKLQKYFVLITIVSLCCSALFQSALCAEATRNHQEALEASINELKRERNRLLNELNQRLRNDAAQEAHANVLLVLEDALQFRSDKTAQQNFKDGILFEDAEIQLHRRGGLWFNGDIRGLSSKFKDRFIFDGLDTSQLYWSSNKIHGSLGLRSHRYTHRKDMRGFTVMRNVLAGDIRVPKWNLGAVERSRPYTQHYTFDFSQPKDPGWYLNFNIPDCGDKKVPVQVYLRITDDGIPIRAVAIAKKYNRAAHNVAFQDLNFQSHCISGSLVISINPDPWVPKHSFTSSPSQSLLQPFAQHITFTATVTADGSFNAPYSTHGGWGTSKGTLSGFAARYTTGQYQSHGLDGNKTGRVYKHITTANPLPQLPEPTEINLKTALEWHRQIRRLRHALLNYPDGLQEFLQECLIKTKPVTQVSSLTASQIEEGVSWFAESSSQPLRAPQVGPVSPSDLRFGPFYSSKETLLITKECSQVPEIKYNSAGQQWAHIAKWRWLGPLPYTTQTESLPLIPPKDGWGLQDLKWSQPETAIGRQWLPKELRKHVRSSHLDSFCWYASCELSSAKPQKVWISFPAHRCGALWVNGALIWHGNEQGDALDTVVLKVPLRQGNNNFIIRAGMDHLTEGKKIQEARLKSAGITCSLAIAGTPKTEPQSLNSKPTTIAPPNLSTGHIPISWDLKTGHNVAWTLPAPNLLHLHHYKNHLLLIFPDRVECRSKKTNAKLWSHDQPIPIVGSVVCPHEGNCIVHCSDGTISFLNREGQLRWTTKHDLPWVKHVKPSPVLAKDIVVCEWNGRTASGRVHRLIGLSIKNGEKIWQRELSAVSGGGLGMKAFTLNGPNGPQSYIATVAGIILDANTGTIIHHGLHSGAPINSDDPPHPPIVSADGSLYWCHNNRWDWAGGYPAGYKARFDCFHDETGRFGARLRWASTGPSRANGPTGSLDGPYFITARCYGGHHHKSPAPFMSLHVYDRHNGSLIGEVPKLFDNNIVPRSIDRINGLWYISNAGGQRDFVRNEYAYMAIVLPGSDPLVLARNRIPASKVPPLYTDSGLFIFGDDKLHLLAISNEADRRAQWDVVLETVINELGDPPSNPDERLLSPLPYTGKLTRNGPPIQFLHSVSSPRSALALGPFKINDPNLAKTLIQITEPGKTPPSLEDSAGSDWRWQRLESNIIEKDDLSLIQQPNEWLFSPKYRFQMLKSTHGKPNHKRLLAMLWYVHTKDYFKYTCTSPAIRSWMSGVTLNDHDILHLNPGIYPFYISISTSKIPPFLKGRSLTGMLGLERWRTTHMAISDWTENINKHKNFLYTLLAQSSDSKFKRQLTALIKYKIE